MKISRGASHSLAHTQGQKDLKGMKGKGIGQNKMGAMDKMESAQVSLSTKAKQIQKATDIAKQDNVDEKKIAYFQNLIDSGQYKIDSARVADKLIDDHMKMPS